MNDTKFIRVYVPSDKATEYLKKDPELKQYWETLNKETNGEILVDPNTKEQIGYGFVYHSGENKGFIFNIEVMNKFRRQGFGTVILNDCVTKFGGVDLTVACDNEGAIKLYLKYGFEIVETVKGQNGRDEYYMKLNKSKTVQEGYISDDLSKVIELFDKMEAYNYGFYANGIVYTGDMLTDEVYNKKYRLMSSNDIEKYKVCVCWDACRYEADWFKRNLPNIPTKVYYCEYERRIGNTHTWLMFCISGDWYVFEHTWYSKRCVRKISDVDSFITGYIKEIPEHEHSSDELRDAKYVLIEYDPLLDKPGITCAEFMDSKWENGNIVKTNCSSKSELRSKFGFNDEEQWKRIESKTIQESSYNQESEVTHMNDLLNQIDLIQEMTDDAELEVMMSLSDAYEKQLLMMESCDSLYIMEDGESSDKVQSVTKRNLKEKIIHFIKQLWRKIVVIFNKAKISILINSTIKEINKHEDDKIPFTVDNLTVLTRNAINRLKTCTSLWSDFVNRYSKEERTEASREENIKAIIKFLDDLNRQLESDDAAYNKASGEKKSQKTITTYQVNPKEVVEFLENEKAAYDTLLKNTMTISKIIDKLEITEKDVADNAGGDFTSDRYTTIINRLKNASNMYYKYMLNQTRIIAKICVDTKAVLKK